MDTRPVDLVLIAFAALDARGREEALRRIRELQLQSDAAEEDVLETMVGSLRRVADAVGRTPTAREYRERWRMLRADGESIVSADELIAFFGSWNRAKEALEASAALTARQIEARFRKRRLGAVRKYSEAELREAMLACAGAVGGPPLCDEFMWWRRRELELAHARGEHFIYIPSPSPYRRRYGSWMGALRHFGFSEEAIAARYEA